MSGHNLTDWLARKFGAAVNDLALYQRALTHGSSGKPDYQRLEFLGDRILGLVIAETLYAAFPHEAEGNLARRLNSLVSGSSCAEIARAIGIGPYIVLGKQARDDGARDSENVLGDVMESLIGACYLDMGFDVVRQFILEHWYPYMTVSKTAPVHPKSALQEWCAANQHKPPEYNVTGKSGPAHNTTFEVTLSVKGFADVITSANSRQAAETEAAKFFLESNI